MKNLRNGLAIKLNKDFRNKALFIAKEKHSLLPMDIFFSGELTWRQ